MNRRYIDFIPVRPNKPTPSAPQAEEIIDFIEDNFEEPAAPAVTAIHTSVTEETTVFLPKDNPPIVQPHFINAEKVAKRPLSPNVPLERPAPIRFRPDLAAKLSPKPPTEPTPEPTANHSDPATIVEKPKKSSRIKFVIAIILTIILGAAAGVVAFLLLPK